MISEPEGLTFLLVRPYALELVKQRRQLHPDLL
jgi:hypothetical protein